MAEELNRERLKELMAERGTNARAVSRAVTDGQNEWLVRDILRGVKSRHPRIDTLRKIADHLQVRLEEFVSQEWSGTVHRTQREVAPRFLGVRYRVQAGSWLEPDSEEPPEDVSLPVLPLPQYAAFPQWMEKVVGDSANKKVPDGHYVHVVDAIEMGYEAQDKDWVIVVRERDQGAVRERTIKQIEINGEGRVLLWPRSTNPRWQEPIDMRDGSRPSEEITVQIVGLVVGAYDPNF